MRVVVDLTRCQGYANCVAVAPEIFDLDEATGQAQVLQPEPGEELHGAAEAAIAGCPVQAISVESDQ
jgi:ferredoxin